MERPGRRLLQVGYQEEPDVVVAIDEIASREGLSRADILRKLVRLGMDRYVKRENIVDALEKASA